MTRRPASLHAVPRCAEVPALHGRGFASPFGTIRALRLPAVRPAALRSPSLGGTVNAFEVSLPPASRTPGRRAWACRDSASPCRGGDRRRRRDLPSSWGTPIAPSPGSSTPAGPRRLTVRDAVTRPPWRQRQGLPHCGFRGSIPRLWCSLSTLRPGGRPPGTQDSLPAAGQALPGGLGPAGFLREVSECVLTSHPPLPSLLGAMPHSGQRPGLARRS